MGSEGGPWTNVRAESVPTGFDPRQRTWVVGVAGSADRTGIEALPEIRGVLTVDETVREEAARDQGNMLVQRPGAVLRPADADDVQRLVRFCSTHGIPVAARGAGHSTHGQPLTDGGLVIDMSWLNTIHAIGPATADVDAGVLWRDLVERAADAGLRAGGLTGYLGLTVGGTLSVGGVSPNFREGGQIDRVRRLEVVTGAGERLSCSETHNADLFDAVLGGLGQCGIITRAEIELFPMRARVRTMMVNYLDIGAMIRDVRALAERDELDSLLVLFQPVGDQVGCQLHVHAYYDGDNPPDEDFLLRDLGVAHTTMDQTYVEHAEFFDKLIQSYEAEGWGRVTKPWYDVFLPDETVEEYVTEVCAGLEADDWSPTGFTLLFIHRADAFKRPMFRVPADTRWVYLFDILNDARDLEAPVGFAAKMTERNDALFAKARECGGKRYPIGVMSFDERAWQDHYGPVWDQFVSAKKKYDPNHVLAPGQGIFSSPR